MEAKWNDIFHIQGSMVEEMGLKVIDGVQPEEDLHYEKGEALNKEDNVLVVLESLFELVPL